MATILSKSPPAYSGEDVSRTVRSVTDYLHYLHENMDYLIGQLKKGETEAGETITAISGRLTAMQSSMSALQGDISSMEARIITAELNYTALEARVSALENAT